MILRDDAAAPHGENTDSETHHWVRAGARELTVGTQNSERGEIGREIVSTMDEAASTIGGLASLDPGDAPGLFFLSGS